MREGAEAGRLMKMILEESKKDGWEPTVRPTTLEQEKQVINRVVKAWDRQNLKNRLRRSRLTSAGRKYLESYEKRSNPDAPMKMVTDPGHKEMFQRLRLGNSGLKTQMCHGKKLAPGMENDKCAACGCAPETFKHLVNDCEAFTEQRAVMKRRMQRACKEQGVTTTMVHTFLSSDDRMLGFQPTGGCMKFEAGLRNILGEHMTGLETMVLRRMRRKKVGPSVETVAVQQAKAGDTRLITEFFTGAGDGGGRNVDMRT